jgi:7-carboxy-7-deazaguanine synthase
MLEIPQLVDRIQQLLPNGKFGNNVHLVITGGEPLLGWQRQYPALLEEIANRDMDLGYLTFETNGTQPLKAELADALNNHGDIIETTFSISSKLPSSGEKWEDAIRPDVVAGYTDVEYSQLYFKWVCSSPEDLDDVKKAVTQYKQHKINFPVYLMPAGGTELLYHKNKQWLSKICLAEGFRYSPRLHIDLFGNSWGT